MIPENKHPRRERPAGVSRSHQFLMKTCYGQYRGFTPARAGSEIVLQTFRDAFPRAENALVDGETCRFGGGNPVPIKAFGGTAPEDKLG
jgi:hypothetical protein